LCGTQSNIPSAEQWLTLLYDPTAYSQVSIDGKDIPVHLNDPHTLEIHIYIDGSVAEVFVNRQIAYTKRYYYPGGEAPTMSVTILGKTTSLSSLEMWQLNPISPNRLTT
jgi:beta-fructofuranosidase